MFGTVTIDRYARAGDSRIPCFQFNDTIMTSQCPYMQDHFFLKNEICRQIAKNRHIATPTTNQMRNLLGMIHVQYEKNLSKTVGCERI